MQSRSNDKSVGKRVIRIWLIDCGDFDAAHFARLRQFSLKPFVLEKISLRPDRNRRIQAVKLSKTLTVRWKNGFFKVAIHIICSFSPRPSKTPIEEKGRREVLESRAPSREITEQNPHPCELRKSAEVKHPWAYFSQTNEVFCQSGALRYAVAKRKQFKTSPTLKQQKKAKLHNPHALSVDCSTGLQFSLVLSKVRWNSRQQQVHWKLAAN